MHPVRRMKTRGGGFWVAVAVFGVVTASLSAWWLVWSASSDRRLQAKLYDLERDGFAVDVRDLAPAPVADAENGALRFERAFALLPDPIPPDAGDAFVERHRDAFDLIEEGAACERFRYSVDYTNGRAVALPHISGFLDRVKLLAARAERAASAGDADTAARSLEMVLGLAHSLKDEPLMISQMIRSAALGIAVDTLAAVRRRVELPEPTLRRAMARLDPDGVGEGMRLAFRGEMALGASFVREVREQQADGDADMIDIFVAGPLVQNDLIAQLDFLARMARAAELPYDRARAEYAAIDREMAGQLRWLHPLTADQVFAASSLHESLSRQQARVALARESVREELAEAGLALR